MSEVFDKATEKVGEVLSESKLRGLASLRETAPEAAQKRWGFKKFDPVYRGLSGELKSGRGMFWPIGYTQPPTAEEYPTKGTEAEWATPEILKDFLIMLEGARHPMSAVEGFKGLIGPTGSAIGVGMTKAAIKGGGIDPTVMRMFVGEEAKLPKKVMKDLDRAKRLDRYGRDREYIYDQTGWFQDPQSKNKWKFEISDAEARIKQNVDLTKPNLTLEDVLHHPELYKAHPEFKKHPVKRKDADAVSTAHYRPNTGEIFIKTFLDKTVRTRLENMDKLLHPRHRKMKTLTQKNKERMRNLIWEFGYRTKKEVDKIPDKQLKDIIEKEVIKDYTKLKESVPHYLTNTDWLINQRKLGAVPNTKQYNRLLKNEYPDELTEIRGTRGIWEPDYIHIPEKPNGRMWSEQATKDLIRELKWGSGRGAKGSIQRRIKINPREARDYRKKPGATDDFRFEEYAENINRDRWSSKPSAQRMADEKLEKKLLNDLTKQFRKEALDKGYLYDVVRRAALNDKYRDIPHRLMPDPDDYAAMDKFYTKIKEAYKDGGEINEIRYKFGNKIADDIEQGFKNFVEAVTEDVPFQRWKDTSGFGHEVIGHEYGGYRYRTPEGKFKGSRYQTPEAAQKAARRSAFQEASSKKSNIQEPLQYINRDMEGEITLLPGSGKSRWMVENRQNIPEFPEPPTYIEKGTPIDLLYDRDYKPGSVTRSTDRLQSFLHEAQHGMQHRSGFSPGTAWSNKLGWPDQLKYMKKDLKRIGAEVETKKQPGLFKVDEALPEAEMGVGGASFSDHRKKRRYRYDPFPEWMTDEFFHYPVSIKYKGKKYSIEEGKESWPSELANHLPSSDYHALREMNKLGKEREAFWDYYKRPRKEQSPFDFARPEFYLKGHEGRKAMSGKEQYLTEAGEAEARNVERRFDLPAQTFPKKDKNVPRPWETLDVKEEMLWPSTISKRWPYPFLPKKKTGGGLSGLGEK